MQIKIVDSWLREFLETKAKPEEIARELSLTSVSVDKTEKIGNEYDIPVVVRNSGSFYKEKERSGIGKTRFYGVLFVLLMIL